MKKFTAAFAPGRNMLLAFGALGAAGCGLEPADAVDTTSSKLEIVDEPPPAPESYQFFGGNLGTGRYWYVKGHENSNARDVTAVRYDGDNHRWTQVWIPTAEYDADPQNTDWIVYGQPVYAMASGEVISCWRNNPENPAPGTPHPGRTSSPRTVIRSGNHVAIRTPSGQVLLHAHMQPDSVPSWLCPHDDTFVQNADNKGGGSFPVESFVPVGERAWVEAGTQIGRVGNSGASSNPHIHVHLGDLVEEDEIGGTIPLAFRDVWTKDASALDTPDAWQPLEDAPTVVGTHVLASPFLRTGSTVGDAGLRMAIAGGNGGGGPVLAFQRPWGPLVVQTFDVTGAGDLALQDEEEAGTISRIAIAHPSGTRDVVTAVRNGSGNLELIGWDIGPGGAISRGGEASGGAITEVSLARMPSVSGVVAAVRTASGDLQVIPYRTSTGLDFTRGGEDGGGAITEVDVARVTKGRGPFELGTFTGVATAVRTSAGDLKVIAFDVNAAYDVVRKGSATGDPATEVNIAAVPVAGDREILVTAARDASGNLSLRSWQIDADGDVHALGSASAGAVSYVELAAAPTGHVITQVRSDGDLRLIAWKVEGDGSITRVGTALAGSITAMALSDTFLDASRRFVTSAVATDAGLSTIAWRLNLDD
jgi:murein DD-endopeptidase MepM/ murein hydrolase activator NlpD